MAGTSGSSETRLTLAASRDLALHFLLTTLSVISLGRCSRFALRTLHACLAKTASSCLQLFSLAAATKCAGHRAEATISRDCQPWVFEKSETGTLKSAMPVTSRLSVAVGVQV